MMKLVLIFLLYVVATVAQEGIAEAAVEIDGAVAAGEEATESNIELEAMRLRLKQMETQLEFSKISYESLQAKLVAEENAVTTLRDALKSECEREKGILVQSNDERMQALQSQVQGGSDALKSECEREKSLLKAEIDSTLQLNKELQTAQQAADRDVKALQFCSSAKEAAEKESGSLHISLTELRAEAAECSAKLKEADSTILDMASSNKAAEHCDITLCSTNLLAALKHEYEQSIIKVAVDAASVRCSEAITYLETETLPAALKYAATLKEAVVKRSITLAQDMQAFLLPLYQKHIVTPLRAAHQEHLLPLYNTHLAPHVTTFSAQVTALYNAHVRDIVDDHVEPAWRSAGNAVQRGLHEAQKLTATITEDPQYILRMMYYAVGFIEKVIEKVATSAPMKAAFSNKLPMQMDVARAMVYTLLLTFIFIIRKVLMYSLFVVVGLVLSPLLLALYLLARLVRCFLPAKTSKDSNKNKQYVSKGEVSPSPMTTTSSYSPATAQQTYSRSIDSLSPKTPQNPEYSAFRSGGNVSHTPR